MADAFISYKKEDFQIAERVVTGLRNEGFSVWWDDGLTPKTAWDEELERETGGTGLRYSFDIKSGNSTQEVGVDARTGRVLENAKEGKNPD